MGKRALLIVGALHLIAGALEAQSGRMTGRVASDKSGEGLSSAQVSIAGTPFGGLTDLDGRYLLLGIPSGTYDVQIQLIGFGRKTVTGVEIRPDRTTVLDVSIAPEAVQLEEITVSAERERGSTAFLLDQRRSSNALLEAVGSVDISRSPDADAAEVATRMTGVTVTSGKYVFVRGLGERYSQTSLNGSPLPSPEPEREVVPLDLFPASFLESLSTQKSYTPELPADFSGGNVAITTREFPDRTSISLGIGTSVNSQSHLGNAFLTYSGGGLDFLGVDDGTRDLPDAVRSAIGGLDGAPLPSDPALVEQLGETFPRQFTPVARSNAPLNRSFDLSIGSRTRLFGRELGVVLAGTYSDDYSVTDTERERKWRTSAFDPAIDPGLRQPNVDYLFRTGKRAISYGGIGNLSYLLSPRHKIALKTTYNRNTDDEARTFVGTNGEDIGGEIRNDRLRFVERALAWGQLSGEHEFDFLGSRLEWKGTLARADRDEPGLREAIYLRSFNADEDEPFLLENIDQSGRYFYSFLQDDDRSAQLDWRVPIGSWSGADASLTVGGAWRNRTRGFSARRFRWNFQGGIVSNLDAALFEGSIVGQAPKAAEFALREVVEPGDLYSADDERIAGYLMVDVPVLRGLYAVVGARIESYGLDLSSRGTVLADRNETDVFPAVNLIYSIGERMKLRAAFSRTLDRPEFRELAPFQFTEATSLRQIFGNSDLKIADITNVDLRWDWFPEPGELVSVGAFYKKLDDPIEQVFIATASSAYSYQNADEGRLFGVELDARKRLGFMGLESFTGQFNLSLIDSEVTVREVSFFIPTNMKRPLEGQSPWVVNAGLSYTSPHRDEVGVYFNVFGERVTAAGGSGIPDIYEQPRHQLDLTWQRPLTAGVRLKVKAENLLDEPYLFEQEANGIRLMQRRYEVGRTLSVTLNYDLL